MTPAVVIDPPEKSSLKIHIRNIHAHNAKVHGPFGNYRYNSAERVLVIVPCTFSGAAGNFRMLVHCCLLWDSIVGVSLSGSIDVCCSNMTPKVSDAKASYCSR